MPEALLCPKFLKDFEKDYKPHQEWLLLCAYSIINNVRDVEYAIEESPFTFLEKGILNELVVPLAIYQGSVSKFLNTEYGVAPVKAEYCERRVLKLYREMLDYYGGVMNTIEKFFEFGFFEEFTYLVPTTVAKFSEIVFDRRTLEVLDFSESAILDFYAKYGYKLPPYKAGAIDFKITDEEARAEVLGKLLNFWHRSTHNLWLNADEDPRKINEEASLCTKGHNFWIPDKDGTLECGTCLYDESWEGVIV